MPNHCRLLSILTNCFLCTPCKQEQQCTALAAPRLIHNLQRPLHSPSAGSPVPKETAARKVPHSRTLSSPSSSPINLQTASSRLGAAGMVLVMSGKSAFQDGASDSSANVTGRANANDSWNSSKRGGSESYTITSPIFRPRNRGKNTAQRVRSLADRNQHHDRPESVGEKKEHDSSTSVSANNTSTQKSGQNGFEQFHDGTGPRGVHLYSGTSEGIQQSRSQLLVHRNICPPDFDEDQQAKSELRALVRRGGNTVDGAGQGEGRGRGGETGPGSPASRFRGIRSGRLEAVTAQPAMQPQGTYTGCP